MYPIPIPIVATRDAPILYEYTYVFEIIGTLNKLMRAAEYES